MMHTNNEIINKIIALFNEEINKQTKIRETLAAKNFNMTYFNYCDEISAADYRLKVLKKLKNEISTIKTTKDSYFVLEQVGIILQKIVENKKKSSSKEKLQERDERLMTNNDYAICLSKHTLSGGFIPALKNILKKIKEKLNISTSSQRLVAKSLKLTGFKPRSNINIMFNNRSIIKEDSLIKSQ